MKRTKVLATAVLLAGAMLAASCGGGRSSGPDSGGTVKNASQTSFGDIESPCGSGNATGATAQGVTDTSIAIGFGDDAGYSASPGLNKAQSDSMRAIIKWCNDQGGINGRKVDGTYYDAKILEANNVMTEACDKVFFLVGEGWSLDASSEATRRACNLPAVPSWAVSPPFSNGPDVFQPLPVPADYTVASPAAQLAKLFPDKVKKASVVYGNYSATQDSTDKVTSAYPQFGWNFLPCPQVYNIQGEADWRPFVQRLKDCGAEVVYFSGSPFPNFTNLLTAAQQLDYKPIWLGDVNNYEPKFASSNTSGVADNVYFRLSATPFEEAAASPATQQYLDIVKAAGVEPSLLGVQSVSGFLLWATASKACGSDLTRACVIDKLKNTHEWTGGGLHASGDPGANLPPDCGMLIKVQGTSFVRVTPTETATLECDPAFAAKTSGPVLDRAKLDADRISAAS